MVTKSATERNIRLIVQTIISSHTGIVHHVEHDAKGTPPHHGFSLLISVECACVEQYPGLPPGFCSRGLKTTGVSTFLNTILDVCSNREPNMKWVHRYYMGSRAPLAPPAGDGPGIISERTVHAKMSGGHYLPNSD